MLPHWQSIFKIVLPLHIYQGFILLEIFQLQIEDIKNTKGQASKIDMFCEEYVI